MLSFLIFIDNFSLIKVVTCNMTGSFIFYPMTKKSSKMTPSKLQENTVVEEEKPSPAPKKSGSEIDEIFAVKKRKKPELGKTRKHDDVTKRTDQTKKKKNKKTKGPDDDEFVDAPSRPRRKTNDGLTLYTEEELGLNKADSGVTPLCPFDCSCCF